MTDKKEEPSLSKEEIRNATIKRFEKYNDLSFFEQYAMFMGKAQILEFGLKKLLEEKFNSDIKTMERWTLGRVTKELETNNLRQDFIFLLKSVVEYRNYLAHELLANQALMRGMFSQIIPYNYYDKDSRILHKAIYELEQLSFLFDWINENNLWI
jgi:hypothetical protein